MDTSKVNQEDQKIDFKGAMDSQLKLDQEIVEILKTIVSKQNETLKIVVNLVIIVLFLFILAFFRKEISDLFELIKNSLTYTFLLWPKMTPGEQFNAVVIIPVSALISWIARGLWDKKKK